MLICTWFTSLSTMPSRFLTQMARRPLGMGVELDNVPLYIYAPHVPYPSIHPSLDTWVVSMSWCLWLMLRWTQGCRGLFKMLISFPLWISPEVELLHHTVILFLVLWGTSVLFSIANEAMSILSSWMLLTTIPTVLRDQGQALKNLYVLSFIIFWQPSRKQWETEGEAKGWSCVEWIRTSSSKQIYWASSSRAGCWIWIWRVTEAGLKCLHCGGEPCRNLWRSNTNQNILSKGHFGPCKGV